MANNPFNNKATARLNRRMLLITFMTKAESTVASSGDRLAARSGGRLDDAFRSHSEAGSREGEGRAEGNLCLGLTRNFLLTSHWPFFSAPTKQQFAPPAKPE